MAHPPDAAPAHRTLQARLLSLLHAGDVDAALQAGLMAYPVSAVAADAPIRAMQDRLRAAWEARERHRARDARLARHAAGRAARRAAPPDRTPGGTAVAASTPAPAATPGTTASPGPPALPPAAAAALARARGRAAGKPPA